MNPPSPEPVSGHTGPDRRPSCWRPASARACARACPRSSTAVRPADARLRARRVGRGRRGDRRARRRPIVVYSPAGRRRSARPFAERADVRAPGRAARDRRRGPGRARRRARRRDRDPRPVGRRPARHRRRPRRGPRRPARGRRGASPWPRSSPPTRPRSGGSCAASSARSSAIVEAKDATEDELDGNEINAGLYAFDADWLRRRIDTLEPSADDRRAVPDRARPARPRGRPARERGRLRGRRPVRRHQRPLAARRRRVEPARPAQRGSTCATG